MLSVMQHAARHALTREDRIWLAERVQASTVAAVAREVGIARQSVMMLLVPEAGPSAALVALATARIAIARARDALGPVPPPEDDAA